MATWTYSPAGVDESTGVAPLCIVVRFSCSGFWLLAAMRVVSPISNSTLLPCEDEALMRILNLCFFFSGISTSSCSTSNGSIEMASSSNHLIWSLSLWTTHSSNLPLLKIESPGRVTKNFARKEG